jgi:hypothetical protein
VIRLQAQEATHSLLGACLAVHRAPRFRLRHAAGLILPAAVLVAVPMVIAGQRFSAGWSGFGPAAAAAWSQPWLLLAAAGGLLWLGLAVRLVLLGRARVEVYERGLRLYRCGEPLAWALPWARQVLWSDLAGVSSALIQEGRGQARRSRLILYPKQGQALHLHGRSENPLQPGEVAELFGLAVRLKDNLYPRLLPGLEQAFDQGQALAFGPLTVHPDYLKPGRFARRLPWKQVQQVGVQKGHLVVEFHPEGQKPGRLAVPVFKIPNLELLLSILAQGELRE